MVNLHCRLCFILLLIVACDPRSDLKQYFKKPAINAAFDSSDLKDFLDPNRRPLSEVLAAAATQPTQNISALIGMQKALTAMNPAGAESDADGEPSQIDSDVFDLLVRYQQLKKEFEPGKFVFPETSVLEEGSENVPAQNLQLQSANTINWGNAKSEFMVSVVERIPVRDQGRRLTCASFAGIGQIEGLLVKKYNLKDIDLSEQRFYFMSKPEHWANGGDVNKGGSNSGTGFAKSNGFQFNGHKFPPGSPENFNIPLESACPYVPKNGTNDLQSPQGSGCQSGVVKVSDFVAYMNNPQGQIKSAQEMFDALQKYDVPMIYYSRLSDNYFRNDGIVTLAAAGDANGATHSGGHAYLVVGARKIDEKAYPGEGGMCFIVKNSWGPGWGQGGYSCVTLAWFNTYKLGNAFPITTDVDLDANQFEEAKRVQTTRPSGVKSTNNSIDADSSAGQTVGKRRGTVTFLTEDNAVNLDIDSMQFGSLETREQTTVKVFYVIDANKLSLRGLLKDQQTLTGAFDFELDGEAIYLLGSGAKKQQIGRINQGNNYLEICSGNYSHVCSLAYLERESVLDLAFSERILKSLDSVPPYSWKRFGNDKFAVELSLPSLLSPLIDVRIRINEIETNPKRFSANLNNGEISFLGQGVGNLTKGELCNGKYRSVCRAVVSGERFEIIFRDSAQ